MGAEPAGSSRRRSSSRPALVMPFTVTVTVSRDPAPFGPSINEVDSVRRSPALVRSGERYDSEADPFNQGIGVSSAPPIKSSLGLSEGSGVVEPFKRRPFEVVDGEVIDGRGKILAGLETEMTRSRARK